jgi:hypothetical protein
MAAAIDDQGEFERTTPPAWKTMTKTPLALLIVLVLAALGGCTTPTALRNGPREIGTRTLATLCAPMPPQVIIQLARIKNPAAKPLRISSEQRRELQSALEPGDVLFTYTAGFSSNAVVPGKFKHVLIYVGAEVPGGGDAIESRGEGVSRINLEEIIITRVNRLAVLRPLMTPAERAPYLADVRSFVGEKYDFQFDFADATKKSCSEVVYCALNNRAGLQFSLTPRAGRMTLTPDDILRYHLATSTPQRGFACVALVDDDPAHPGDARLTFGDESQARLAQLMSEGKK